MQRGQEILLERFASKFQPWYLGVHPLRIKSRALALTDTSALIVSQGPQHKDGGVVLPFQASSNCSSVSLKGWFLVTAQQTHCLHSFPTGSFGWGSSSYLISSVAICGWVRKCVIERAALFNCWPDLLAANGGLEISWDWAPKGGRQVKPDTNHQAGSCLLLNRALLYLH